MSDIPNAADFRLKRLFETLTEDQRRQTMYPMTQLSKLMREKPTAPSWEVKVYDTKVAEYIDACYTRKGWQVNLKNLGRDKYDVQRGVDRWLVVVRL